MYCPGLMIVPLAVYLNALSSTRAAAAEWAADRPRPRWSGPSQRARGRRSTQMPARAYWAGCRFEQRKGGESVEAEASRAPGRCQQTPRHQLRAPDAPSPAAPARGARDRADTTVVRVSGRFSAAARSRSQPPGRQRAERRRAADRQRREDRQHVAAELHVGAADHGKIDRRSRYEDEPSRSRAAPESARGPDKTSQAEQPKRQTHVIEQHLPQRIEIGRRVRELADVGIIELALREHRLLGDLLVEIPANR